MFNQNQDFSTFGGFGNRDRIYQRSFVAEQPSPRFPGASRQDLAWNPYDEVAVIDQGSTSALVQLFNDHPGPMLLGGVCVLAGVAIGILLARDYFESQSAVACLRCGWVVKNNSFRFCPRCGDNII